MSTHWPQKVKTHEKNLKTGFPEIKSLHYKGIYSIHTDSMFWGKKLLCDPLADRPTDWLYADTYVHPPLRLQG